ncbi:class I SAM-dependent methyltransferase [Sagittula salina]|uniref:Methyltransferase regulatory domain-containing protein n=1 Tax=Sagittula salina TaxID=2820268 RepID=A0A940S123_9RHOB|nr:class I SAM-dependent methyltransferase [Sagittula salina]MBP0482612.1 methyltransferase regulatory domain-containing protein [Sagittula salina]
MSEWNRGYPTDSVYIDAIQPAISPWRWQQALRFAGRDGPDPTAPFRFLELGCGTATTLIALAAAYPQGRFSGYDFMPEPVHMAREIITQAGLPNVAVIEASFDEMAAAAPEAPYDYAFAHGVWSWVPEAVRAELVSVLGRWLAPGALVYMGYNTAAGWSASEPIRQIFRLTPQGPPHDRFGPARAAVTAWLERSGDRQPMVRNHWATMRDSSDGFIAHELGNPHGTGLWMEDVAAALDGAKLRYAGPSVLAEHLDAPFLAEEDMALLRHADADGWVETARDLLHGRYFRKDLYHRGAPAMGFAAMMGAMRALRVIPWDMEVRMATHMGVWRRQRQHLPDDLADRIRGLASEGGSFGAVMEGLEAEVGMPEAQAFQIALLALISGHLLDIRSDTEIAAAQAGCDRLNAVLLERGRYGQLAGLVSPVTGTCLQFPEDTHREALAGRGNAPALFERLERLGIAFG